MFKGRMLKIAGSLLVLAHLGLLGCKDNPSEPSNAQQPDLPPLASMQTDLQFFTGNTNIAKSSDVQTPGANFNNAVIRVLLINTTVTLVMAVPVATFAAAISQNPTLEEDGKFHWKFTVEENGRTYQADLAGWVDMPNSQTLWEMRITVPNSTPELNDFLWYTGSAKIDNSSGQWRIFDHTTPDERNEVLQIDWSRPAENEADLVFTVVKQGAPENGDKLTYHVKDDDRSITLFDNSADNTVEIFWDAGTGAGYLIAPSYRNGEKSCWDENRNDVACSN